LDDVWFVGFNPLRKAQLPAAMVGVQRMDKKGHMNRINQFWSVGIRQLERVGMLVEGQ
jgi:hypothetical protein